MSDSTSEEAISKQINKVEIIDDDKNTQLHYTCSTGDAEQLMKDMETHPNINVENYLGWTPLMMAVRNAKIGVVKILLEKGADATRKNKFGYSVFMMSVASGSLEMVQFILQHLLSGGVSKRRLEYLQSPLSMAVLFKYYDIVNYLLDQLFNVNATNHLTGVNSCMVAAAIKDAQLMKLLIEKGADMNQKNYFGHSVLDIPIYKRRRFRSKFNNIETPIPQISLPPAKDSPVMAHPPNSPYLQNMPVMFFSPQSQFFVHPDQCHIRKSSNVATPNFIYPPNLTPVAPATPMGYGPQVFFPANFSPSQPVNTEFLNAAFYQNPYISQHNMLSPAVNYLSPC